MKLLRMSTRDYETWVLRSKRNYASDKVRANNLTEREANEIAEKDFLRLLPDGINTKDNFLFTIKSDVDAVLGYLWFSVRGAQDNRKAFICDIIIEEAHRGKGFGRQAMQLAEQEAKNLGLKEIGLHVFGFNAPAIALYESLGYKTTDLVMAKTLS